MNENTCSDDSAKKIKTFIFLDLEATGLPSNGRPRITEISMVAVHRGILLESNNDCSVLPRVLDKMTMCVCPMKPISHGAATITGLHNDMLEYQKDFDQHLVNTINLFISRHEAPVCLVAHNGVNFDFGLLQSEYESLDACLPENVLCIDSLAMFREIDENEEQQQSTERAIEVKRKLVFTPIAEGKKTQNIHCPLMSTSPLEGDQNAFKPAKSSSLFEPESQEENNYNGDCDKLVGSEYENPVSPGTAQVLNDLISDGQFDNDSFFDDSEACSGNIDEIKVSEGKISVSNEKGNHVHHPCETGDTLTDNIIAQLKCDEKTTADISSNITSILTHNSGEAKNSVQPSETCSPTGHSSGTSTPTNTQSSSKTQSPWYTPTRLSNTPYKKYKHSYKLKDIHKRVVGWEAQGEHRAEDDCIALLRICQFMCSQVCKWADLNAVAVSSVPPLYSKSPKKRKILDAGVFPYHSI